jgi:predicted nucleic acid-binding protein
MIIDTDVLIWYLRGNKNARTVIHKNIPFKISVVNYMELVQGMKDKKELRTLKEYLKKWSIKIIQINESISVKAMFLVEDYYLSHSMELADAIIVSTALEHNEILLTGNDKHYSFIPNLEISKFRQSQM